LTITIAYCEYGLQFYGVWIKNLGKKSILTKEYQFLASDLTGDDKEEEDEENDEDDDEEEESKPNGRLKNFMTKYMLRSMGG